MNGHLVSVEVRVERGTHERVNLDSVTFDEGRSERLNTESVESRGSVKEHILSCDDVFEDRPYLRDALLDESRRASNVVCKLSLEQLADDERLEELKRHVLWKSALVESEVRTDDDHRSSRVVHSLSEEVSSEETLLSLEVVRKRLKGSLLCEGTRCSRRVSVSDRVVDEGVHGLLEDSLLVSENDVRRLDLLELGQSIVSVDDASVEVVDV